MTLKVMYFAWVRERIGVPGEEVETSAATVAELVAELRTREDRYALAFSDLSAVRVAIDQELTDFDAGLEGAREVAFSCSSTRTSSCSPAVSKRSRRSWQAATTLAVSGGPVRRTPPSTRRQTRQSTRSW